MIRMVTAIPYMTLGSCTHRPPPNHDGFYSSLKTMTKLRSLEEANEISAVRLVTKRQSAKVGDIFRLCPRDGILLWGRFIKRSKFFGVDAEFNLVYIYDAIGQDRPSPALLSPQNLIIAPSVVQQSWLGERDTGRS
jgi:hypothetical protein